MAENEGNEQPLDDVPEGVTGSSKQQHRFRTERFQQIYANNMAVGFSAWDMYITFGEIMGEKDGAPVIEETVKIIMPHGLGKVFAKLLAGNIKAFEDEVGEIPVLDIQRFRESKEARLKEEAGLGATDEV